MGYRTSYLSRKHLSYSISNHNDIYTMVYSMNIFHLSVNSKYVWFRVFNKGISFDWSNTRTFSERNNLRKSFRIGKLKVEYLK